MLLTRKKIGIDARFYGPETKGIGRYTQEIVDHILDIDNTNDYVIFLSKDSFDNFKITKSNVKKVLADVRWYTIKEQIVMPRLIKQEGLDLMHFPHFNVPLYCPVDFIVTIHDLILTKFPTTRASTLSPIIYWFKNLAYRAVIFSAVRRAKKIIAVSQYTKEDIINKFGVDKEKVVVTLLGLTETFFQPQKNNQEVLKKYNIRRPFVLYVGNAYPHKNLELLIRVFSKLSERQKDIQLVMVGKTDYFYKRLKEYAKNYNSDGRKIIFTDFVADEDLSFLYRQALVYVFPSLYEGFGLPPLEAMSQGCPVLSSNESCLPEILGEAADYFNPKDEDEMLGKIEDLMADDIKRERLINKGKVRIQNYSWSQCAKETLVLYNQAKN